MDPLEPSPTPDPPPPRQEVRPDDTPTLFRWTSRKVLYILFISAFVLSMAAMIYSAPKANSITLVAQHSDTVRNSYNHLLISLLNVETGTRGYVITGREEYLEPYYTGQQAAAVDLEKLRTTPRSKLEDQFIKELTPMANQKLKLAIDTVNKRRFGGEQSADEFVGSDQGKRVMDDIRAKIGEFDDEEAQRLTGMHEGANRYESVATWTFFIAAISFIAMLMLLTTSPTPPRPPMQGIFPWKDF